MILIILECLKMENTTLMSLKLSFFFVQTNLLRIIYQKCLLLFLAEKHYFDNSRMFSTKDAISTILECFLTKKSDFDDFGLFFPFFSKEYLRYFILLQYMIFFTKKHDLYDFGMFSTEKCDFDDSGIFFIF